uniref:Arrestin domain containing 2 n=1 Tax=Eptatretus burgeri TaxID=7764 RepID=A0A8C4N206_EPTBU
MVGLGRVRSMQVVLEPVVPGDSAKPCYRSGETVRGRVSLDLRAPLRVRLLRLEARGGAQVRWTESRSAGSNTAYTQNYSDELEYFCHRDTLLGNTDVDRSDEQLLVLPSGRHEFDFSFVLPAGALPNSFEGKYGWVRYWVKAKLFCPWSLARRARAEITVLESVDLNTPPLLMPVAESKQRMVRSWLCMAGNVSISAKIARKGYCLGEAIPVNAEFENATSRPFVARAALYQTQTFLAKGRVKRVRQLVASITGETPVAPGSRQVWEARSLEAPPVCPSVISCSIIRVEYNLVVCADVKVASKVCLGLPVVLGTVPLHAWSRSSSISSQSSTASSWDSGSLPVPEAPPSYVTIAGGEEEDSNVEDEVEGCDCGSSCGPALSLLLGGPETVQSLLEQFRLQPPPMYSESDPNPLPRLEKYTSRAVH